jgi:hypothetical protein
MRWHCSLIWLILVLGGTQWAPAWGAPAPGGGFTRPPADQLRADLQRILARPEFHVQPANPNLAWQLRMLRALVNWWEEHIAPYLAGLHTAAPFAYWVLVGLTFLLAALLIYHITWTLRAAFAARRPRPGPHSMAPERVATDPTSLLQQADAAAGVGDFGQALRHLYLALIRQLDRRRIVRYDPSRTNRDYLRQSREVPDVFSDLLPLNDEVEGVWYGGRAATAEQYARCRQWALSAWEKGDSHGAL